LAEELGYRVQREEIVDEADTPPAECLLNTAVLPKVELAHFVQAIAHCLQFVGLGQFLVPRPVLYRERDESEPEEELNSFSLH